MQSNTIVSAALIKTGAFRDLDKPVILASGELGIYFINVENLLQDKGEWEKKYGEDPEALAKHACGIALNPGPLQDTIQELARHLELLLPVAYRHPEGKTGDKQIAISGGMRRDVIVSGPVASLMNLPHIALFKQIPGQKDKVHLYDASGKLISDDPSLENFYVIHVVDLLTEGSSVYNNIEGRITGWTPMLRARGAEINNIVSVVDRLQGAQKRLLEQKLDCSSMVYVDNEFLSERSRFPDRAVLYKKDPKAWSQAYLREHGALEFLPNFDPTGKNVKRATGFMARYGGFLAQIRKYDELDAAVKEAYNKSLTEVTGITKPD